ncbi:hypothetical protein F4861DRAFT_325387 [Xylaria intraflava]|nr:hypothetical protein F4861DRAFT_325387 [Xylaria intraflava]
MANLPAQHPNLSLHLTDKGLATLITSARTPHHHETLTALSNTALNAHESAQRLALGAPQRIIVEHSKGPLLLQTFLGPRSAAAEAAPTAPAARANGRPQRRDGSLTPTTKAYLRGGDATDSDDDEGGGEGEGIRRPAISVHVPSDEENAPEDEIPSEDPRDDDGDDENPDAPPMLVGIVVAATPDETPEARRAAARLERVGHEIQGRWAELQVDERGHRGGGQRVGDD